MEGAMEALLCERVNDILSPHLSHNDSLWA